MNILNRTRNVVDLTHIILHKPCHLLDIYTFPPSFKSWFSWTLYFDYFQFQDKNPFLIPVRTEGKVIGLDTLIFTEKYFKFSER